MGSIADREYLIPENAIDQLRNFLMRIGLQFPVVETPLPSTMSLPLNQWGGRFGKDVDTPFDEFVNDDGITDRLPGGLSLEIKTEAVANGSWKVYAEDKIIIYMYEKITVANWVMFAMRNYDNPQCEGEEEFYEDIKRFKYLKRLFKKYYESVAISRRD